MNTEYLLTFYTNHLRDRVMPFWTENCIDWEYGGINNCVDDNGVVQSHDKYLWSQGRALWVFSALYNYLDQSPDWLLIADNIASFLLKNGPLPDGAWAYCLNRDGSVREGARSVYTDAFMIHGFTEYARATGCREALDKALAAFERTSPLLEDHDGLPTDPHRIPEGFRAHGPSMIFALAYHELGTLTGREDILMRALDLAETVMTVHLCQERKLLFEFVDRQGRQKDSDAGNTIVPGHAIESMWFMERIYAHHGNRKRCSQAMDAVLPHLELGWDSEYGGLFLACHAQNGKPQWYDPSAKVWWVHTEALYALLRASTVLHADWAQEWHARIHDYTFRVFPNLQGREWHHYLDRKGRPIPALLNRLPVKDPFHLPRALLYAIMDLSLLPT